MWQLSTLIKPLLMKHKRSASYFPRWETRLMHQLTTSFFLWTGLCSIILELSKHHLQSPVWVIKPGLHVLFWRMHLITLGDKKKDASVNLSAKWTLNFKRFKGIESTMFLKVLLRLCNCERIYVGWMYDYSVLLQVRSSVRPLLFITPPSL